jgi:hypothetical protein
MFDEIEVQLSKIYGDKADEDDAPIQYQFEQNGDVNRSVIEADMDRDDILPVRITLAEGERNRQHAPLAPSARIDGRTRQDASRG